MAPSHYPAEPNLLKYLVTQNMQFRHTNRGGIYPPVQIDYTITLTSLMIQLYHSTSFEKTVRIYAKPTKVKNISMLICGRGNGQIQTPFDASEMLSNIMFSRLFSKPTVKAGVQADIDIHHYSGFYCLEKPPTNRFHS